jgi:hypothetical protein
MQLTFGYSFILYTAYSSIFFAHSCISPSDLDVWLGEFLNQYDTQVKARIFNPTEQAISLSVADFSLVLGFVANPTGMAIKPVFETQSLETSSALDIVLNFPYAGEGFGVLTMLGRVWGKVN